MSLVCFCWQCSRFSFWVFFSPYVGHDVKSIPLAGWQFVQVTLQQHVFHVLLNWPFMYHRKLRPLFLPDTVLLRLTDKFVCSRWLSFTFSLSDLPVRFPFCPKFGNFRPSYSIVYLNCCGLCRLQPRTDCRIPFCFCMFLSSLLSIPCHECLWLQSTFAGDKRFGLVFVGQVVCRGMQERERVGSCFRFYHRYVKLYSDHDKVFSDSTRPRPTPQFPLALTLPLYFRLPPPPS